MKRNMKGKRSKRSYEKAIRRAMYLMFKQVEMGGSPKLVIY